MSLQYLILGLLHYRPMTGYDLKYFMDNSLNFFWTAHLSQIYRELTSLETKGLALSIVEPQEGRPDRKVYKLTDLGRETFAKWLPQFPTTLSPADRDEFMVRIFFGSWLPTNEIQFQLNRYIKEKETELLSIDEAEKVANEYGHPELRPMEPLYWRMLVKRRRMLVQCLIEWTKECLEEIEKHKDS